MKILVITDLYPVCEDEIQTPRTIYNFVQSWIKQGYEVNVIKPNFLLNSFLRNKPFYKSGKYGNVENVNFWLPFIGNINDKIKTNLDSDIVIAHMPSGLITANRLGLKYTAAVHISDLEVLTNPIYSIYFKKELENAYKNADKIACRSYVIQKKFLALFPEHESKTFIAYSGINEDIITKRQWQKSDKYKVLTCANLIKRKNVDKIIEACKDIENVELTVIGDGKELPNLKKISPTTIFTGRLKHEEVLEKMRDSDIFILPSENETFGMVYLEAMASGCITVGLKGDGIDGIIKNGENGYLCELNNIKDVINSIISESNQNDILENCYSSIKIYTDEAASANYLNNVIGE